MSNLHDIKTDPEFPKPARIAMSPRAGTRITKTRKKTAHACGTTYEPTGPWSSRSQGVESSGRIEKRKVLGMKKQAQAIQKGDVKST